jgi:hypothetical protein
MGFQVGRLSRGNGLIFQLTITFNYTQEGNKLNFLRNKNHFEKPQRGDINIAWGNAPGNPSYDHVNSRFGDSYTIKINTLNFFVLIFENNQTLTIPITH